MERRSDPYHSQENRLPSNVSAQKDHLRPALRRVFSTHPGNQSGEDHGTLQRSLVRDTISTLRQYIPIADPTPIMTCDMCLESWTGSEVANRFTYRCPYSCDVAYCMDCLKKWFLGACDDESKMPPRCCSIIPLAVLSSSLSQSETEKYKAKFEEWNTSKRLYCPKPTCSAFIPKKLYAESKKVTELPISPPESPAIQFSSFSLFSDEPRAQRTAGYPMNSWKVGLMSTVRCPECLTVICTKCSSLNHLGNCPNTIDLELDEQLMRWNIKRCPKCRQGVRKVDGCSRTVCRCGAHFCYVCLKPFLKCGGCNEAEDKSIAEDDLDGQAGLHGNGIGDHDESYLGIIDAWDCTHDWKHHSASHLKRKAELLECHNCFQKIKSIDSMSAGTIAAQTEQTSGSILAGWPQTIHGEPAWQCSMRHKSCYICPRYPLGLNGGIESFWRCDCPKECDECRKVYTEKMKMKVIETAWDCRCGLIVCGACRVSAPL